MKHLFVEIPDWLHKEIKINAVLLDVTLKTYVTVVLSENGDIFGND